MKKEFEIYQDEEGNVYTITTELEQLIIQDLYKAMKRNNEKQDEIERLNNIINELEHYLNEQVDYMTYHSIERMVAFDCCRHKLQELKGSDKE